MPRRRTLEELQAAMNTVLRESKKQISRNPDFLNTSGDGQLFRWKDTQTASWYRVKVNSMLDCDTAAVKIVDIRRLFDDGA